LRELTTPDLLALVMDELGRHPREHVNVYFTGGATAILHGWRPTTVDIDLRIIPESDEILRALPSLKERLRVNIELAAPDDFIPELPGWRERSIFIRASGNVSYFHYDLYSQALAKIQREHVQDIEDVTHMLAASLVERQKLRDLFEQIEPALYRFPAIDPSAFRRSLERALAR
jgi:hypothetical protein